MLFIHTGWSTAAHLQAVQCCSYRRLTKGRNFQAVRIILVNGHAPVWELILTTAWKHEAAEHTQADKHILTAQQNKTTVPYWAVEKMDWWFNIFHAVISQFCLSTQHFHGGFCDLFVVSLQAKFSLHVPLTGIICGFKQSELNAYCKFNASYKWSWQGLRNFPAWVFCVHKMLWTIKEWYMSSTTFIWFSSAHFYSYSTNSQQLP